MARLTVVLLLAAGLLAPASLMAADEGAYPDRPGLGGKVKSSESRLPGLADIFGRSERSDESGKAMAAQPPSATKGASKTGDLPMERVTGIGGFFFRSEDPDGLAHWYAVNLGVDVVPTDYDTMGWQQQPGTTIFAPFKKDTDYFGKADQMWMINFRVRDLDAMVAQLRANGISVEVDAETYPNGRFARLEDPEGNPIQLWQPAGPAAGQ